MEAGVSIRLDMIKKVKKEFKSFGLIIGFSFPIVIGFIIPKIWGHPFKLWTLSIGFILIILALTKPSLLKFPYKYWMKIGEILGWVNSRIILGSVFILVLQPIAFFMYLLGYDPLRKNFNNDKSYKETKEKHRIDFKRIF
mgnify:CR=1 FL=1